MRKMLLVATMLGSVAIATETKAQANFAWYISNFSATETTVSGQLHFRNTQTEAIDGKALGIYRVSLSIGGSLGGGGMEMENLGNVYAGPLDVGGQILPYRSTYFVTDGLGMTALQYGLPSSPGSILNGAGVLGCVIPEISASTVTIGYSGVTCDYAGYDGWKTVSFFFGFTSSERTLQYTADDLTASALMVEMNVGYSLLPEPSTWAMMVAGLAAVATFARRRNRLGA